MSDVVDININKRIYLFAALAMCLSCQYRWVAGVPKDTSLFKLECPSCHEQNSFASVLPSEYLGKFGVDEA